MIEAEGYVDRITFRNEDTGYTVLYLANPSPKDGGDDEVCCVGCFSFVSEGEYLVVRGQEVVHKSYGPQIQMESYEEKQPDDAVAVEKYLGSGAIKGIGPTLAGRIVKKFQSDTFKIIEEEPERLAEIKGISMKMAVSVAEQFLAKRQMRQAMMFLQDYGISMNMSVKIYKFYKDGIYEVLRKNPYKLAEDIPGVGFKTADSIAMRAGFCQDSQSRIQAGILYALQQSGTNGHCYLPEDELATFASELLMLDREIVSREIDSLVLNKEVTIQETADEKRLYISRLYYMELDCARMLVDLNIPFPADIEELEKKAGITGQQQNITLDELQKQAACQAAMNGVMIITGGPGTGKTTTINTILALLESEGLDVLLAAPTGRAAKRMSETSGREAQTIHRLLEVNGGGDDGRGGMHFERNELQPLEADAVIVDEFSMVDIYLLHALLKALVPGTRLIIAGDVNQLPSVGPGNVLKDMIQSGFCNVVKLNHIFRQAAESEIVTNAHKINAGVQISLDNKNMDFFHLERDNPQDVINVVIQLVMKNLPPYVNATAYDIQVLTPVRKGLLGVENLNKVLQGYMNMESSYKREKEFHSTLFRENDKVMQVKNNYQIRWSKKNRYGDIYEEGTGVFNGDIGVIKSILDIEEKVIVEFEEGKLASYDFNEMDELELAYAVTVHKSQGSEYPAVIIPILGGPRMLLNRNLLYTAVTRAKKCVTIVGSKAVIYQMIKNINEQKRYSGLCQRIVEMEESDIKRYS
ncbi:MAG TPA: ATP-dependent RecD-like DNA helicase [Lachnospiraceae bacterium]|nr:ATP-dependent RecD-like DNA helicase [Lachnospiraceae bacterium]